MIKRLMCSRLLLLSFIFSLCSVYALSQNTLKRGEYYLRNKASGLYLNAGALWGTQAVLSEHALAMTIEAAASDSYYIFTGFGEAGDRCLGWDNGYLYLDRSSEAWAIRSGQEGFYVMPNPNGGYVGYDGSKIVATNLQDPASDAAQWEFLTREQMLTGMLSANHAVDATFLISNPRFDRNFGPNNWEGSGFAVGGEAGGNGNGNFCAEVWNTNFDVNQTLENVPNGQYRLKIQGFYRYNNTNRNTNSVAVQTHQWGMEQLYAKLYANDVETSLQSIVSEREHMIQLGLEGGNSDLPFSMTEAANAFSAGLYTDNQVVVNVTDHHLTIGVRKTRQDGCDWTIWDNFELTLLALGDNSDYDVSGGNGNTDYDNASFDNPIDMTSKIVNPQFQNTSGWAGAPVIGGWGYNTNAEKYNTTFDVNQKINGLPNGWYRLKAQGFYRYGDYKEEQHKSYYGGGWEENDANNMYAMYTIPYAVISRKIGLEKHLAMLYGNRVAVGLPSPFDYAHEERTHTDDYETELGWVPNTQGGATEAFSNGEYPVELLVPVTDGTLTVGVKKSLGYKYDWACWDNFRLEYLGKDSLVYVEGINVDRNTIDMVVYEKRQLSAKVMPAEASDTTLLWSSSNTSVVEVDANGLLTARGEGSATITVRACGADGGTLMAFIPITVGNGYPNVYSLKINEIQVSNTDMFVDPSYNYGGYIELYNPSDKGVSLRNLYVSDDASNLLKCRLTSKSGAVPAKGFGLIWFDHRETYDGQVDFKLDMDGGTIYLSDANGNVIASETYPPAVTRTSYTRIIDGHDGWAITAYPTPGKSNAYCKEFINASNYTRLEMPVVSHESQLFKGAFTVNVDIPQGATLYYTTDGSTPTETNGMVSSDGTFEVNKTTILRLRLFKQGMLPSAVKTCSYIYNDKDYMLPVLSVVSAPVNLYDDKMGILVTGTNGITGSGINFNCNWNMEWDRPANFDYIDGNKGETYSQEVDMSRFGGWSRSWYPYNFKLNAQKVYENLNYMDYPFFGNKPYLKHKVLQVRNGGNDLSCRIKDASLQHIIISSGFHLDCQDYMPVHGFINGQYTGMLNMREPSNKHFAYSNYGIDTDLMDQMELGGGIDLKVGNLDAFNRRRELSASAAQESTYKQICDLVDIDEFINYMATQIFLGGDDWPGNNCKAFKGNDGKFHIVLFDIDQALRFDAYAFTHIANSGNCPLVSIFLNMMQNDTFRKQFIDTFCLVGGSVFEPGRCAEIINRMSDEMNPALALEGLSTEPTAGYMKGVLTETRRNTMMNGLENWNLAQLNTTGQRVKLSSNINTASLQVNGLDVPTGRFDGTLFAPMVLTASAPEGYVFQGWLDENGGVVSSEKDFDISTKGNLTLVASFKAMASDADLVRDIATPVKVNEVSAGNSVYVNDWMKKNDWFELFNNTDESLDVAGLYVSDDIDQPLKYQIPEGNGVVNTIIPAGGHLIVWADKLESISQIHTNFKLANVDGNMVLVSSSDDFVARNSHYFASHPAMRSFVEGMTYIAHGGDQTVGRYPDGGRYFYKMSKPTIERTNTILSCDSMVGEDQNLMLSDSPFALNLAKGWNWVSHNLSEDVAVGKFSNKAARIVGHDKEAFLDATYGMVGSLKSMAAGNLYKVKMDDADLFTSDVASCRSDMPIALLPGWNWIGYPVDGTQTLAAALADYPADDGDQIVGQDGFSIFADGTWTGSLNAMETGHGYLLFTNRAKILRFASPMVPVNINKARRSGLMERQFGVDKHAYPNVMGMVAVLEKDGVPVESGRFIIVAYSDDVCRGAGKWVDDLGFVTIYGEGGEDLYFRALDQMDGSMYEIAERFAFQPMVKGSMSSPCVLAIGEMVEGENVPTGLADIANGADSTIEGFYSIGGVKVSSRSKDLPSGLYVVKFADGTCRKVNIK